MLKIEPLNLTISDFFQLEPLATMTLKHFVCWNQTEREQLKDFEQLLETRKQHYETRDGKIWYSGSEHYAIKHGQIFKIEHAETRNTRLRFYSKESAKFSDSHEIKLTKRETEKIAHKIARHFKFRCPTVWFNTRTNGHAYYRDIEVPKNQPSLYILIHELAHVMDAKKRGTSKHDKKLWRILCMMHKYAAKMHYWITTDLALKTQHQTALMVVTK